MSDGPQLPDNDINASVKLGTHLREGRKRKGLTIATLADNIGRPREWLNRIELGYSEFGEYSPLSSADLQQIATILGDCLTIPVADLELLRL